MSGQPSRLTNSNEKLEKRYKEILKENDGKLFQVKKGQAGGAPLMRSLSTTAKGYNPLLIEQVFRRQLSQQTHGESLSN